MPVERELWFSGFSRKSVPALPCPRCKGVLAPNGDPRVEEPKHMLHYRTQHSEDWSPEYDCDRFSLHLQCTTDACGEIVVMAGRTVYEEFYDETENGWNQWGESLLVPKTVYPAPPMFRIPPNTPDEVAGQLGLAFQLYWTDLSSCLGRVRTSVELLLDDLKIPTQKVSQKTGKTVPMNLSDRIDAYKAQTGDQDASDSFDALRLVGNLGTHETKVSAEALFDAMDVYEDVLIKVYGDKSVLAKKAKLIATKGKY